MRETIGFIGAGNMGGAMIEGIAKNKLFNTIWVCDHHQENLDRLHEKGLIQRVPSFHRRKKKIDVKLRKNI